MTTERSGMSLERVRKDIIAFYTWEKDDAITGMCKMWVAAIDDHLSRDAVAFKTKPSDVTRADLLEWFTYNAETGNLHRIRTVENGTWAGGIAGGIDGNGYRRIRFNGRLYREHQLVWAYFYGSFPVVEIDHINGNRIDNRVENLRLSNRFEQTQNIRVRSTNNTGFKHIVYVEERKKYRVGYKMRKKNIFVGHFDTLEEAKAALKADKEARGHPDSLTTLPTHRDNQ